MASSNIGRRIADPRQLSDELGANDDSSMYSGLATYTFGALSPHDAASDPSDSISPLTLPRLSPDRTPRPSVASSTFHTVSSHPSHGSGRPASSLYASSSQSRRYSHSRDLSYSSTVQDSGFRSTAVSGSDSERSEDPSSSSTDPIIAALYSSRRGRLMSDTASQHTFGRASRSHGVTAAPAQDGAILSSSSISVATSRSSSRASMRTTEHFSSDDELEFDYYDEGKSSPVTFARYDLADIDEDAHLVDSCPSPSVRSFVPDGRRGSLPMAIPGAVQVNDACSREGSILTIRRPSRSWDDTSTHRSSHSGEDPTLILPKSEPHSRADWLSVEAQIQAQQQQRQQEVDHSNVYEGLDLGYILSRRPDVEGSIRSAGSRLSFVHGVPGHRRSSPHIFLGGSTTSLAFEDSFMKHLQKNDRAFNSQRYFWSFQRERADASGNSSRRRQQAHPHKAVDEASTRVQEMWRCGHVGRFKVDKLMFKPQASDSAKGSQQRIHIRHIPDPFLMGNTVSGPHSVVHKHSRALAFSIFRSHGLFANRQAGGIGTTSQTHMNMRSGIMLAPKKVQEQYTSTKTTRQLSTHGLLDDSRTNRQAPQNLSSRERESRDKERKGGQAKEDRAKGKPSSKGKTKDRSDKKLRVPLTESTGSSSAGSVKQAFSTTEPPTLKIELVPSTSSSTTVSRRDSASRPASPSSLVPSSIDPSDVPESETSSIPQIRHYRDSLDSDDRLPLPRTTHAEAFSALDPNDIENLRSKANNRPNTESSSTFAERIFRVFRGGSRTDEHPSLTQTRAFQPPWLTTAGRDQQEENDRVLNDLNASFRDVGLLHSNPHRPSKANSKRKASHGILDHVPDDCLYMLLPLWPGESDTANVHAEISGAASFVTIPENRQYLLVYYVPFIEKSTKGKKAEKKKAKQSHSSDSGVGADKNIYLSTFRAVARVVSYDELRLSGVRVPSDGLAINGPEWEAMNYPASVSPQENQYIVICQCLGRDSGYDFLEDGLLKLKLCTPEDHSSQVHDIFDETQEERPAKMVLTPIGRAVVEMIWLGCLAITSFGPT